MNELARALDEKAERHSRARALLESRPNSYYLIRFGFQDGIEELYRHV